MIRSWHWLQAWSLRMTVQVKALLMTCQSSQKEGENLNDYWLMDKLGKKLYQ